VISYSTSDFNDIRRDIENLVDFKSSVDLWYPVDCYDNDKSWDNIIQNLIAMQSQVQNLKLSLLMDLFIMI
jgi:hypothetical protein